MIVRKLEEIKGTAREVRAESGTWSSCRLLLQGDGMGFSLHDTTIFAGTRTLIHYRHHVEGVYCIEGRGRVELVDQDRSIPLSAGTMYALDRHEKHYLVAETDLRIICVFNPALAGDEDHDDSGVYPPAGSKGLRFAYLNLREHPRGNFMLERLISEGFEPTVVIEEDSSLAEKGRRGLAAELEKISAPMPSLAEIIKGRQIEHHRVANHNDATCETILREARPDLIVLGDTRIIRPSVMKLAGLGVVNVHPGYLPVVKGNNPYIWAILHDLPQGCTVHFIDEGIDTGPIIQRRRIRLPRGVTYPGLLQEINVVCGELLVEALYAIKGGMARGIPQASFSNPFPGLETFRLAPPEVKAEAIRRLESGAYACFEEGSGR